MKTADSSITVYGIKEVHAEAGQQKGANDIFVYTNADAPITGRMNRPARSAHFGIHLHLGGTLEIKYNLINYTVHKDSLFIVHPGIVHSLLEDDSMRTISVGFSPDFFAASMLHKKYAEALGFLSLQRAPLFLIMEQEAQTLYPLMIYLKSILINGHAYQEEMIHYGFNLFMLEVAAIAKKYRGTDIQGTTRQEDILMCFLKQLAVHFKDERSVEFYANSLFITPKHLTKTVKELTTKTCSEFIDEMVIAEAKILLGDFSYSVGQVADALHFSDQFFFSKFFKNHSGLSPLQYKNSL